MIGARAVYLSDDDLAGLDIGPEDIRRAIEAALLRKAADSINVAPKAAVLPGSGRYMMTTLSTGDDPDLTVVKSVMVSPENPGRGLPGITGSILVQDSQSGVLRAVMDAGWITAVRTAGLSAVAARRMANPASATIGFVGCGVQARSHLQAFRALFPLKQAVLLGRSPAGVAGFRDYVQEQDLGARVAAAPEDLLREADIVVTSITLSYDTAPFLDARQMKPGAFAAITDLAVPWVSDGNSAFASLVIDDHEQEASSPTPMVDPALVSADLTELVNGSFDARYDPAHPSAFAFRGIAIGDYAATVLALKKADAAGVGKPMG